MYSACASLLSSWYSIPRGRSGWSRPGGEIARPLLNLRIHPGNLADLILDLLDRLAVC